MIYLEHTPAPPLNRFVRMLWYAQAPQPAHRRERVLPTGRTQVILNLARDFILDCPEEPVAVGPMVRVAPSLVIGSRSVYEVVDTSDMADLIGMVFEPGAFPVFAGDAADLFSNRSVDLEDIWGAAARSLRDRLREIPTPAGKLGSLEADLTARLNAQFARRAVKLHGAVDFALTRFGRAPGVATVAEVAKSTGWSERSRGNKALRCMKSILHPRAAYVVGHRAKDELTHIERLPSDESDGFDCPQPRLGARQAAVTPASTSRGKGRGFEQPPTVWGQALFAVRAPPGRPSLWRRSSTPPPPAPACALPRDRASSARASRARALRPVTDLGAQASGGCSRQAA